MSLSTRMALVMTLLAVLCAGGTGGILYSLSSQVYEEVLLDRQRLLAVQGAAALLDDLNLAIQELDHISKMVEVDLDDADDGPERRVLNEAWRLTLFFFDGSVMMVDDTGLCHGAEPKEIACHGRRFDETPWFKAGKAATEPVMLFESHPERSGTISLVVPMHEEGGELEGVLLGEIELGRGNLFDESVRGSAPPPRQLLLVGSSTGRRAGPLFTEGAPPIASAAWQTALASLARGEAGSMRVHLEGHDELLAWTPVARTGAGMIYAWRWSELDPHGDEHMRSLVVATIVMALAGMGVGIVLSRRVSGPLLSLAGDVRRARAHLGRIDPGSGSDEVAELRRVFAALVDELAAREAQLRRDRDRVSELAATLEARVADRSRELEETRDALIDAERLAALGRAGAALSHELRNSLNTLSVGMDAMGADVVAPQRSLVREHVHAEIARLRSLADRLLDYAGPRTLASRSTTAGDLVDRSLALVEDYASERGVDVQVRHEASDLVIHVDDNLLHSVFSNLIRNAVNAVSGLDAPRRRVCVIAAREGDTFQVDVADAGEGVADGVRDQLFQPFVSGRPGGVGLGLAVAKRFVELHGGSLELVEGPLDGACLRVRLPLNPTAPAS